MAALVFLVLVVAMVGGSDAAWCVCIASQLQPALQKTLDYACGAGADCNPINQNGACYNPNTVAAHCSYAANSYYQRNGQAQGACVFSGTAMLTSNDPSSGSCTYPATPSAAGSSSSPGTNSSSTPGSTFTPPPGSSSTPGSTITPPTGSSSTPGSTFTPGGTGGGIGGLGPSGNSYDGSGGSQLLDLKMGPLLLGISLTALVLLRRV